MAASSPTKSSALRAANVWKSYDGGAIRVLNGVDFEAHPGETVALCGPSGCGKSTLLYLLGGLDEPDRGEIEVNGVPSRRGASLLHLLRHEVGFVFQLHNLIPDLTLEENCLLPALAAGVKRREAMDRLTELVERTGLASRRGQCIQKLSGGERQRTALCRALMNRPGILLADEPTGSLDDRTRGQVFELLLDLAATDGLTLVMATHDRQLATQCGRLIEMKDGQIRQV